MSNIRVIIDGTPVFPNSDFYPSITQTVRDVLNKQPATMPISLNVNLARSVRAHQFVAGHSEVPNINIDNINAVAPYLRHKVVVEIDGRDLFSGNGEAVLNNTTETEYQWEFRDGANSTVEMALNTKVWEVGETDLLTFGQTGILAQIGGSPIDYILHAFSDNPDFSAGGYGYLQQLRPCYYAQPLFNKIAAKLNTTVVIPTPYFDFSRHAFQVGRCFKHSPQISAKQTQVTNVSPTHFFPNASSPSWVHIEPIINPLFPINEQAFFEGSITGTLTLTSPPYPNPLAFFLLLITPELYDSVTGATIPLTPVFAGTSNVGAVNAVIPITASYPSTYFLGDPRLRITIEPIPIGSPLATNVNVTMNINVTHTFNIAEDIPTNKTGGGVIPYYTEQDVLYSLFGDMTIAEFIAQWVDFFGGDAAYLNNKLYVCSGTAIERANCGVFDVTKYVTEARNISNGIGNNQTYLIKRTLPDFPLYPNTAADYTVANSGDKGDMKQADAGEAYFTYTEDNGFIQYKCAGVFTYNGGKTVNDIVSGEPQCYYVLAQNTPTPTFDLPMTDNVLGGNPIIPFERIAKAANINAQRISEMDKFSQTYFYYGLTCDFEANVPSEVLRELLYGEMANGVPCIFAPISTAQGFFRLQTITNAVPKYRGNFTLTAYADRRTNA